MPMPTKGERKGMKAGKAKARFGRDAQFQLAQFFKVASGVVHLRIGARLEATRLPVSALED